MVDNNGIKKQRLMIFQQNGSGKMKIDGLRKYGEQYFDMTIVDIDEVLPQVLDDTSDYLPTELDCDLVLDFFKHNDLSTDLATLCQKLGIPVIGSGKKIPGKGAITPPTCCGLPRLEGLGYYGKYFGAPEFNIEVAKVHAGQSGVEVDYRATTAEDLAAGGEKFDVVLNMEVVEHVSDVNLFMTACCEMVKPGGLMFVATINRTAKAKALAIFMAENVLRWLPKGTHTYEKLVKPNEIEAPVNASGMQVIDRTGVFYNPLSDSWAMSRDMDVNYMMLCERSK